MIPPQASDKSGEDEKFHVQRGGSKPIEKYLWLQKNFPPNLRVNFCWYWETTTCLFHVWVWEFPLDRIAKIPLFWHCGTILVGFENEYQSKTWSKIFLKNPILSVQKNDNLTTHPINSQISLRFPWKKGACILSSPSLDHPIYSFSRDPNVKRWIVDGTSEENLGSHNHTLLTMCSELAPLKVTRFCWERRCWKIPGRNSLLHNLHLRLLVNKIKLTFLLGMRHISHLGLIAQNLAVCFRNSERGFLSREVFSPISSEPLELINTHAPWELQKKTLEMFTPHCWWKKSHHHPGM